MGGYDGHKRCKGADVHVAVGTRGYLLSIVVTPANTQERSQLTDLTVRVKVTGETVDLTYVDADDTGPAMAPAVAVYGLQLEVVKLEEAQGPKHGCVLLSHRWVVARSFARMACLTFLAFVCLMLHQSIHLPFSS